MADSISNLINQVGIGPLERNFQGNSVGIVNFFWAFQKYKIGGLNNNDIITDTNLDIEAKRLAIEFIFSFYRIDESVEDRLKGYIGIGRSKFEAEKSMYVSFRDELTREFNSRARHVIQQLFGLREPLLKKHEHTIEKTFLREYADIENQSLFQLFSMHLSDDLKSETIELPIILNRDVVISFQKKFKPAAENFYKLQLIDDLLGHFKENKHLPFIETSEYLQKKENRGHIYLSKLNPRDLT